MSMIYLDCHATTPVDPRVLEAMLPCFTELFGNPGSVSHAVGERAREEVDRASQSVARLLGVATRELVFTSGATESCNLAIRGVAEHPRRRGDHLIAVATEHKAVLDPLAKLGRRGWQVTLLPVADHASDVPGLLDVQQVIDAVRPDTALINVMYGNNEIGLLQPLQELTAACRQRGVPLHCDATQAVGKTPIDLAQLDVDLLSFSGHKFYGPKGVGGLVIRRRSPRIRLDPQIEGGGQQRGFRSGTLNVPGIVGLAAALKLCSDELPAEQGRQRGLRDRLFAGLQEEVPEVRLNGPPLAGDWRLTGNLNCTFPGVDGEALMMNMPQLAVSSGSACTSAEPSPSHVLRALGLTDDQSRASLRFGLGRFTTAQEIDQAVQIVAAAVLAVSS